MSKAYANFQLAELVPEMSDVTGPIVSKTWAQLKAMRDGGTLVPGQQYRITDYQATTIQENSQFSGKVFDIIVTADSTDRINETARAMKRASDTMYFVKSDLNAWRVWYCIDNDGDRFDWAVRSFITISNINYNRDSSNDVTGASYPYCWSNGTTKRYTTTDHPTASNIARSNYDGSGGYYTISRVNMDDGSGKGVVYRLIDEFGNDCPYDFKGIQFKRWAIDSITGQSSIDFTPLEESLTYSDSGLCLSSKDSNTSFDGTVVSVDSSTSMWCYTFSHSSGSSISDASVSGSSYPVRMNRIMPAYSVGSARKLNNIVFFNNCSNNTIGRNSSFITFGEGCSFNVVGGESDYVILAADSNNNKIGDGCSQIFFGGSCTSNTIHDFCYYTVFVCDCCNNVLYHFCESNTLGSSCYDNVVMQRCYGNLVGDGSCYNSLGIYCCDNSIGTYSHYNTFGSYCCGCIFGSNGYSNTFGSGCSYVKFGTSSTVKSYCRYIEVKSGVKYVYLNPAGTTSGSAYFQNVVIDSGISGTGSQYVTITDSRVGQSFNTEYKPKNSEVISV